MSGDLADQEDARQFFHAALGLPALFLPWHGLAMHWWVLAIVLMTVAQNARIMDPVFGRLSRPSERAWWDGPSTYAYGVLLAMLLLPRTAAAYGWLVLSLGDAASNYFGRRWPLITLRSRRSLGGFLAMVVFAGLAMGALVGISAVEWPGIWTVLALGLWAGVLEFGCNRKLDNLVLPVGCGLAFGWLTGVL